MESVTGCLSQGQHVGLFGLRKVGKTSLIKQIQQRFVTTASAFIDCQAFSANADMVLAEILRQIWMEMNGLGIKGLKRIPDFEKADFRKEIPQMFELWKKIGSRKPFLVIFDELDKFFPPREVKGSDETLGEYVRIFRLIRGLAQSHNCFSTLGVAYRPDINRHNLLTPTAGENPMFKSFQETYLGFLTHEESARMIMDIGLWKDIVWERDAAEAVFAHCGGHPLVTRYFASAACDAGELKEIDGRRVKDTAAMLRKTFRKNDIANYYKEGIWMLMLEKERKMLLSALKGPEKVSLEDIPQDMEEAVSNLERFGLIDCNDDTVRFTAGLFRDWLIGR